MKLKNLIATCAGLSYLEKDRTQTARQLNKLLLGNPTQAVYVVNAWYTATRVPFPMTKKSWSGITPESRAQLRGARHTCHIPEEVSS